jgi:pyrophosphatase PpaX
MSSRIEAVVFDMDGVVLDSRELIYRAFEDTLATHGVEGVSREMINEVLGKPVYAMYELLAPHKDAYQLEKEHIDSHNYHLDLIKPYPDAKQTLEIIRGKGMKTAIFTGFNELTFERLDQIALREFFDVVVDSTQYKEHKPSPEGLFLALKELSVSPEQAVYIGDAVSDMLAGKAAGVRATIGITQGFGSREALEAAGADYIVNALSELPELMHKLGAASHDA